MNDGVRFIILLSMTIAQCVLLSNLSHIHLTLCSWENTKNNLTSDF